MARAVRDAAFVNPFSEQRTLHEQRINEALGVEPASGSAEEKFKPLLAWVDRLPEGKRTLGSFTGEDRILLRALFLFEVYHRFYTPFDRLIEDQMATPARSLRVPFADEVLQQLEARGFTREEATRFLGMFFQLRRAFSFIVHRLRGASPCMKEFRRRLWNSVFTSDTHRYEQFLWNRMEDFSTLLLGETGTGKGAAAAAIGRSGFIPYDPAKGAFAANFNQCFLAINMAQFPETLLEAELFGYRKGAFTGAIEAHQGVFARCSEHGAIFLDEIGDVAPHVQVKLLTVLQERLFSPVGSRESLRFAGRVIAATNKSLGELRARKMFRDDFFYRISSDVIEVPSLRQRLAESDQEMRLLLETILEKLTGAVTPELLEKVNGQLANSPGPGYAWPGNVRELEQAVRRILVTGHYVSDASPSTQTAPGVAEQMENLSLTADELLGVYCRLACERLGSRAEVARRLGLDTRTVLRYLQISPHGQEHR